MVNTEDIINKYKLFWQYPAITEKQFYLQEKDNAYYFGLPWATIRDKRYNQTLIFNIVKDLINKDHKYYTCCQHISYKTFIPLWKALNITKVYISHKQIGINNIDGIELLPCPLFAVNFETKEFNKDFKNVDFINVERPILYSFIGGYQPRHYMSNIRQRIFDMKHPDNTDIINTGVWHLDNIVFSNKQNYSGEINKPADFDYKTNYYNNMLIKSIFTLCPSGTGPNSIRFWEALACGSIPILLSDTLQLPYHELWDKAIVRVKESELNKIPQILSEISEETRKHMRENCVKLYNHLYRNYINMSKTLFTSYKCSFDDPIIKNIINKWQTLNLDFNVKYFSDEDVEDFFKKTDYYLTYKLMKNGVAIADFFRICYIQKYGGYWFDIGVEPTQIIIPDKGIIHLYDLGFENISYMLIGGKPNQNLFQKVIDNVIINIHNNHPVKKQHIMEITGPRVIQNIIFSKLKIRNQDGCFKGTVEPKIYLKHDEYEFIYTQLIINNKKTNTYQELQKKYNKLNYGAYNYV